MKIIIFDVCWTMFKSNTTFDFIDYVMGKQKSISFKFFLLRIFFVKFLLILCGRIIKKDLYRMAYVYLLKGFSREEITCHSKKFYSEYLLKKKVDFTFDIVEKVENEKNIILCSASLDVIVSVIASNLKLNYMSSELGFEENICTGKISNDLLGNKDKLFNHKEIELVVTDNLSDLNLVKCSNKSIILSEKKNIKFWLSHDINVDYVFEE